MSNDTEQRVKAAVAEQLGMNIEDITMNLLSWKILALIH